MKWAIVCSEPMILGRWQLNDEQTDQMWTESEVPANTIINIIEYDGQSEYIPPDARTRLVEVSDELRIGEVIE